MNRIVLDLQFFTETGDAAPAAAPEAMGGGGSAAAETTSAGPMTYSVGDTLPDGQVINSAKVAAELNRQMARHPEMRKVYGQNQKAQMNQPRAAQAAQAQGNPGEAGQPGEMTIQEKWEAAKKGEFKDLYGADVQAAVRERFKNQADAQQQLDRITPALEALMERTGFDDIDDLCDAILDDPSLYEEAAEAEGLTVEQYKEFKALREEHDRHEAEAQQSIEDAMWDDHFRKLTNQADELRKTFPNFDLRQEMENPTFLRLTHPSVGLSVEDAFYAVHRQELEPQFMAYGIKAAREKMGQTIQAQRARPAEGAMGSKVQQAGEVMVDFSKMSRPERDEYRRKVHAGLTGGRFA